MGRSSRPWFTDRATRISVDASFAPSARSPRIFAVMEILMMLLVVAMFAVPLGLIVVFVVARTLMRKQALTGPWTALAQQNGGQVFDGPRLLFSRGTHQLSVELKVVSVMEAMGGGYPDGGTFTVARLAFDPAGPNRIGSKLRQFRPQDLASLSGVPAFSHLPPDTLLTVADREARVVLPGAVADPGVINTALSALGMLAQQVKTHGSLPA